MKTMILREWIKTIWFSLTEIRYIIIIIVYFQGIGWYESKAERIIVNEATGPVQLDPKSAWWELETQKLDKWKLGIN